MYFEDESRFGLFTKNGKALTASGVKPICPFHQIFKSLYLFGAFSPIDGDSFLMEMPACNADIFQLYINELAKHRPNEFKIMVMDNGAFHKAKALQIPENMAFIFLPPYSPELNPAEQMWQAYKREFSGTLYYSLDELSEFIDLATTKTTTQQVKTTCAYEYIFTSLNWTI